jgi:BASS family bile acid:Na+ symporter
MPVILESLATLSVLVFVVSSMLAMGLRLTVGQILDPLSDLGLFVKWRYADTAAAVQPIVNQAANTALLFLLVLMLVLNFDNLIAVIGTGAILALAVLVVASAAVGYLLGGPGRGTRSVLGLGTGQRNISAALVVGAQNFDDPDVVTILLVGALLMLVVLLGLAGELGRRIEATIGPSAGGETTSGTGASRETGRRSVEESR